MHTRSLSPAFATQITGAGPEELTQLDPNDVISLFKDRGALWFHGFGVSLDQFNEFAARFGTDYMSYRGGGYIRKEVKGGRDKTLLSVSYDHGREKQDTFPLPLHGEMYYTDNRPVMLWFYCEKPAAEGGETTICDGSEVFAHLSADSRKLLTGQRLRYVRTYQEEEWSKVYQTGDIDDAAEFARAGGISVEIDRENRILTTNYVHPAIIPSRWGGHEVFINNMVTVLWQERVLGLKKSIVRFEDGSEIPEPVLEDIRKVQQDLVIPIPWASGDFAMIDNSRALHGRWKFSDPEREVLLRMVRSVPY